MIAGKFIGVNDVNTFEIKKTVFVKSAENVKMQCACLGLFFVRVNGIRVGNDYLMPGWSSYNNQLYIAEFDLSQYIKSGDNEIAITVNEGWYKGPVFWERKVNFYGRTNAVCAQIDIGDDQIVTDLNWSANSSQIINSGIYDGETVDLTVALQPLKLIEVEFDKSKLKRQICPFVQTVERIEPVEIIKKEDSFIYDFGQNFAGVVEVETPEDFNGTLTMRFAEILVDGDFYNGNLGSAKATDIFTCQGRNILCPEFTYHGFRYMELKGVDAPIKNVNACVRHTPMKKTGSIVTSNKRINKLISNIFWSQRSNFVDIPTDCPQRAERLGWTGDINAFCGSAAFNYDIRAIMRKWLDDVVSEQTPDGEIPLVVPDVLGNIQSSAMWCDVIVMTPFVLYEMYNDISFISDYYESMKKFVEFRIRRANGGLIKTGYELGDWLALDNDQIRGGSGRTDPYFIVNVFQVNSLKIVSECAKLLGISDDVSRYKLEREKLLKLIQNEYFTSTGRLALDTLTAQALALYFDIIPKQYRARVAADLDANISTYHYRIVTGFIGTPYLLFALSDNGYHESACKVLLNNAYPGWLYEVDMEATTVWERWNSLMPDGQPNPDGMNSYNHYAYGSVIEFIYKRIAGLAPVKNGFYTFNYTPKPCKQISEIRAEYLTDKGIIEAGYVKKGDKINFFMNMPKGFTSKVTLPNGISLIVKENFTYSCDWESLDCPPFSLDCTLNEIYSNPKAQKAFEVFFKDRLHPLEIKWVISAQSSLAFLQNYLEEKNRMNKEEFERLYSEFNNLFLQEKIDYKAEKMI